jgi:hypothetical protein
MKKHFILRHIEFFCILTVCSLLRLCTLFDYQFTYDELSGLERSVFGSFSELIEKGVKVDAHPALIQVYLYFATKVFGNAEALLKLPFILLSLGSLCYAYLIGLRHFSKQAGLLACSILAFSLLFVFHAPVARMYTPGVFFSLGLVYHHFQIMFSETSGRRHYFLFGLFALLSAYNHHMNALFALTLASAGFFVLPRHATKRYILTCIIVVLAYLPHVPVTVHQLGLVGIGHEQGGWLDKPPPDALLKFIRALFGTGYNYLIILAFTVVLYFLERRKNITKRQWLLLALFLLNYGIIHVYSVLRAPVFQNSVMMFAGTALILFVASFFTTGHQMLFNVALIIVSGSLLYTTYLQKDYYDQCVETVYDVQFKRTGELKSEHGDEKVYPLFFGADRNMKRIYFRKYQLNYDCLTVEDSILKTDHTKYPDGKSAFRYFNEFVSGLQAEYLVMSAAMPLQQAIAKKHFPFLIEHKETQGNYFQVFSKNMAGKPNGDQLSTEYKAAKPGPLTLKDANNVSTEFPYEAKAGYKDLIRAEGQVLLVKAKVKVPAADRSSLELCISVNDAESNAGISYAARSAADYVPAADSTITIMTEMFMGSKHNEMKDAVITCYLWNKSKSEFRVLDFSVEVIDYWQDRWHYWD